MAPVILELKQYPQRFQVIVVVTAQHREMLDSVLSVFEIVPDYDLQIILKNQTLGIVLVRTLRRLEPILTKEKPDLILVQGDASSAFASALAGYYQRIPVGHIEAGLRTGDKFAPFPEEVNRRFITVLADIHFAPTERARQNLINEGVNEKMVFVTGNTVIDALLMMSKGIKPSLRMERLVQGWDFHNRILLVTLHRRESFGNALVGVCRSLLAIVNRYRDVMVVFPVHLNPNVRRTVYQILAGQERIKLLEPLLYPDFIWLLKSSYLVLTDSGGIQEEAPVLGKPVLVLRERTERPEAIDAGTTQLVGLNPERIISTTAQLLESTEVYHRQAKRKSPFGDGKAAKRIRKVLTEWLA